MEENVNSKDNYLGCSLSLLNALIFIFLLIFNFLNLIVFYQDFTLLNSYFISGSFTFFLLSLIGYIYIISLIKKNNLKAKLKNSFYLLILYFPLYFVFSISLLFIVRNINIGQIFYTSIFLGLIVIVFFILIHINLKKDLANTNKNNLKFSQYLVIDFDTNLLNESTYEEKKNTVRKYIIFSIISYFFLLDFFFILLSFLVNFNSLNSNAIIFQAVIFSLCILLSAIFITIALYTGFKNKILSKKIFIKFGGYVFITILYLVYFYLCIANLRPANDWMDVNLYIAMASVIYIAAILFYNIAYSPITTYIKSIKSN